MKTVKVEFDEKYHSILAELAGKEFRSIKATVEFIVTKYLDSEPFSRNLICNKFIDDLLTKL